MSEKLQKFSIQKFDWDLKIGLKIEESTTINYNSNRMLVIPDFNKKCSDLNKEIHINELTM